MKRCINIDWLEVYCIEDCSIIRDAQYYKSKGYKVDVREYGTRQYSEMFTIYENDVPFIEIRRNPYSVKGKGGIMAQGSCHIRLTNNSCYRINPIADLQSFLVANNYTYKNISRIDIALDFNMFDNGLSVDDFISTYFLGDIAKVNQCNVSAHGTDSWAKGKVFNSMKWGSLRSPNTTKLYNKSLELRQGKSKDYIIECWEQCGLDISKDVYRIEFSMTSQFQTIRNKKSGECVIKDLTSYQTRNKLLYHFIMLYNKYFDFRKIEYTEKGELKRKYDCSRIKLFDFCGDTVYEPVRNPSKTSNPTKTLKILSNMLYKIYNDSKANNIDRYASMILIIYIQKKVAYYNKMKYGDTDYTLFNDNIIKNAIEKINNYFNDYNKDIEDLDESLLKPMVSNDYIKSYNEILNDKLYNITLRLMRKFGIIPQPQGCPF